MYDFKANIAVLLNITPDHLDRYNYEMQNYVNAKFRILQNQTKDDSFIYWEDDPVIAEQISTTSTWRLRCCRSLSTTRKAPEHTATATHWCSMPPKAPTSRCLSTSLALNGLHNLYNSMAAGLSASLLNIKKDVIRKALSDFQSVEHRLEYVDTINGIRYVNDSKATNVNSCWYALESMKTPVVLILGGKDKGNDYSEIEKFVTDKVSAIVCMGKDNEKIKTFFAGKVPVIADTHSIGDAVSEATRLAKSGDTVLLSPCCASFDLFKSLRRPRTSIQRRSQKT